MKKFRIRLNLFRINLFRITVNFFLTDTCLGIIKSSGLKKFCPNSKFPDKSSAGLARSDCIEIELMLIKSQDSKVHNLVFYGLFFVLINLVKK
jgi:hypothetical protein